MTFYATLPTYCDAIFESYAPYNKLPGFWEGLEATGYDNPYDEPPLRSTLDLQASVNAGVAAQAWDRGREARMRCEREIAKKRSDCSQWDPRRAGRIHGNHCGKVTCHKNPSAQRKSEHAKSRGYVPCNRVKERCLLFGRGEPQCVPPYTYGSRLRADHRQPGTELRSAAERMRHTIVEVYRDHGISGAKGRDKRPAFDKLHRERRTA